jgi:hypothetical protein
LARSIFLVRLKRNALRAPNHVFNGYYDMMKWEYVPIYTCVYVHRFVIPEKSWLIHTKIGRCTCIFFWKNNNHVIAPTNTWTWPGALHHHPRGCNHMSDIFSKKLHTYLPILLRIDQKKSCITNRCTYVHMGILAHSTTLYHNIYWRHDLVPSHHSSSNVLERYIRPIS